MKEKTYLFDEDEWLTLIEAEKKYKIGRKTLYHRFEFQGLSYPEVIERKSKRPINYGKKHLVKGEMITVRQASEKYDIKKITLYDRMLRHKITLEDAVNCGKKHE